MLTQSIGSEHRDFFSMVYQVVRCIPPGRVSTYGAIARYLGSAKSARMVGWAMNACHTLQEPVPAHRVVNRLGLLSGKLHFETPYEMERLLKEEGILVKNDKIERFNELFWDPMLEMEQF